MSAVALRRATLLALPLLAVLVAPAGAFTVSPTPGVGDLGRGANVQQAITISTSPVSSDTIVTRLALNQGPVIVARSSSTGDGICTGNTFVAANRSCQLLLDYTVPLNATPGPYRWTLEITGLQSGQRAVYDLTGNVPSDNWSVPSSIDLGPVALGSMSSFTVNVTNTSTSALTVNGTSDALGSGVGSATETTIPAGATRPVPFAFAPTDPGDQSATLTFSASSPGSPVQRQTSLRWSGVGPKIELTTPDPLTLNAGDSVALGTVARNVGNQPLTITGRTRSTADPGLLVLDPLTLPRTIQPGASLPLGLRATATGQRGFIYSEVAIDSNDPITPTKRLGFSALATAPTANFGSGSIGFPDVMLGNSADRTLTIANNGDGALSLTNLRAEGGPGFSIIGATSRTVAPGSSTEVTVRFTPTVSGGVTGTLLLSSNVNGGTNHAVQLSGRGIAPASLTAGALLGFGDVAAGMSSTAAISISNAGDLPLTISSTTVTGTGFTLVSAPTSLGARRSADVQVRFSPTVRGDAVGLLTITSNGGTRQIALAGRGIGAQGDFTPPSLDLGTIPAGTTTTRSVQLDNIGELPLTITGLDATDPAVQRGTLPATVPAKESRSVQLRVTPTTTGPLSATVTLRSNSDQPFSLQLTATVVRTYADSPAFTRDEEIAFPGRPSAVTGGDVNGDGDLDLAAASGETGEVWTALGNGDGTFGAPASLSGTSGPGQTGLAAADLDEDGALDLTTGSRTFLGDGAGGFATGTTTGITGTDVAVGDLDADGHEDLVVVASPARLSVAFGDGSGAFGAPTDLSVTEAPSSPLIADLDRDGDLDIAVGGRSTSDRTITVLRNDGTGALAVERYAVAQPAASIAVADLNGDLRPDLTAGSQWLPGQADGTFDAARSAASRNEALAVADFDGDGNDDQVVTGTSSTGIFLSRGLGDGSFDVTRTFQTASSGGTYPADLAVGDVDGDGRPDLLAAKGGTRIDVLVNGNAAVASGAGAALITEARFGSDGYLSIRNLSRSQPLRLTGWQLRTGVGGPLTFPAATTLQPGGSLLVSAPARGGWSLGGEARSAFRLPSAARGAALVDSSGATVDAVGTTSAPASLREGAGLAPVAFAGQGAYVRRSAAGRPVDSGDNAADFRALDTAATTGAGTVLGAPRPDGVFGPTNRNDILQSSLLDPSAAASASPNRVVRPATAGQPALLTINRTITNCSGGSTAPACANADRSAPALTVTKLRFRITELSTVGASDAAILRVVGGEDASYGGLGVRGLPVDAPSPASGGGLNATLTATQLLPAGGLVPGASITVAFTFRVDRAGAYRIGYDTEDDLVPYRAPTAPAPSATPTPTPTPAEPAQPGSTEPVAVPVPDRTAGTVQVATLTPAITAPKPSTAKAPATKRRCVTRAKYRTLSRKQRAKVRICRSATTKTARRTR